MVGVPVDENPPANEDDAANEPHVKRRCFEDCDFLDEDELDEEETLEVAAGADGLRRAVTGEFDALLLVPEAQLIDANSPTDPLAWWKMHNGQFLTIAKLCSEVFSNPCIICSLRTGIFASKTHSAVPAVESSPSMFGGMCHD